MSSVKVFTHFSGAKMHTILNNSIACISFSTEDKRGCVVLEKTIPNIVTDFIIECKDDELNNIVMTLKDSTLLSDEISIKGELAYNFCFKEFIVKRC